MPMRATRLVGAVGMGVGLGLLDRAASGFDRTAIVAADALLLSFIAVPVVAGQQDGAGVEVFEGAFDGLAAFIGQFVGLTLKPIFSSAALAAPASAGLLHAMREGAYAQR
jgi:hypothetical protein